MDQPRVFEVFAGTFGAIFLAELGDKTQLATLAFSAGASSNATRWIVFAGSAVALVTASALGVIAGAVLARFVPLALVHKGAGALFVILGLWMVFLRGG
jgi:putative Ca2+/H+ antiporter (TMEM165/GDT1 family)